MSVNTYIMGNGSKKSAEVDTNPDEKQALVVATRSLKTFNNKIGFFLNDVYGKDMNQNAAVSGTPEKVHDGIDNVYWTASIIAGTKFTFDSTDYNHTPAGTKSVKTAHGALNDTMQFTKGSSVDLSNYVSLTMWVYIVENWLDGDSIRVYGWDTGTSSIIGTPVNLENYFNWEEYGTWHQLSIPLVDMNLTASTIDSIQIEIIAKDVRSPLYYIDDIQFEESGTPVEYSITAGAGAWFYVNTFAITFVDNIASTLADATMQNISYNKILGVSELTKGITYQQWQDGNNIFSSTFKKILDFLELPNDTKMISGSDGTNTWISIYQIFNTPIILKSENEDKLSFVISDNLSGLTQFRISAGGYEEDRQ